MLNKLLKQIDVIERKSLQNENQSQKRNKERPEDVRRALKEWFSKVWEKDGLVKGLILSQELAKKIGDS